MPKAIFIYKLPEEAEEMQLHWKGPEYSFILDELDNWLRGLAKYQDIHEVKVDEVREKIRELEREYLE